MTTPNQPFPRDHELKWMRFASLGMAAFAIALIVADITDSALGIASTIGAWLFAIGLVGSIYASWILGWRESKRKEVAKLRATR